MRSKPSSTAIRSLVPAALGVFGGALLVWTLGRKSLPPGGPTKVALPVTPSADTPAPAAGPIIALDRPTVSEAAQQDLARQQRNYKLGYQEGLMHRDGGTGSVMPPRIDEGFMPYFDQGDNDGQVARRPQFDDAELLDWWNKAKDTPAWDWSQGPRWES